MARLNLGSGTHKMEGYTNIDCNPDKNPDIVADLRKLPVEDDSVDEIQAIHIIEHFYIWETLDVLKEWHRVLKVNGILVLELPDMNKILYCISKNFGHPRLTWWGLYGDPSHKDPHMTHRWAFTPAMLSDLLKQAGFTDIEVSQAQHHIPERDMRITAKKKGLIIH